MNARGLVLVLGLALPALGTAAPTGEAHVKVVSPATLEQTIAVRQLHWDGERLRGELVNEGEHELRNIELLLRYSWVWHDVRAEHDESPGWAEFRQVQQTIPPGGRIDLAFEPRQAPPTSKDGELLPSARVTRVERMP